MSSTEQQTTTAAPADETKKAEACQPDGSCACPAATGKPVEGHQEGCCEGKQCPPKTDAPAPKSDAPKA